MINIPEGDFDVLTIGETLVDFISIEETDWLRNAYTFRKYQGGSPANIAVYVAKLGGQAAVISKLGIGAMGQFLKAELGRAGVTVRLSGHGPPGSQQHHLCLAHSANGRL